MPETDILNPIAGIDWSIGDSMNPSYGFENDRPSTMLRKRTVGGGPWSREMDASPHVFTLGWRGRTLACAMRLRQYFEQYEGGDYFTVVDHDAGGRHYVGTFTTGVKIVDSENNKYDVEGVRFEEIPGVPMVQYPSNWDRDSVFFGAWNDRVEQKLATSGSWTQGVVSAAPAIMLGGFARTYQTTRCMTNPGTTAGDYAPFVYRGYGFKLWMQTGPAQGKADVYVDGVLNTTVDCYAAASAVAAVLTLTNLSLNIHDIKVVVDSTKNALSTGTAIGWYGLQVMR